MAAKAKALDFTNVKERSFNSKHLPEGDYPAKVIKVEDDISKNDNPMWVFTLAITGGRGKGASYPYRCTLDAQSLWKVRNIATACGINVAKKKINFDPNKLVGKACGITLVDGEYNEKPRSEIDAVIPLSEVGGSDVPDADDDDEEVEDNAVDEAVADDEPKASKKGKKGKKGKKAKAAVDDSELEELEIDEL